MEYPPDPNPHDAAGDVREEDQPNEEEFPPSEKTLLDDDFLNTYGRDPEEKI